MKTEFKSLYEFFGAVPNEQAAIDYFKAIRWANGEFCPHCGHDKLYGFEKGKMAGRQWKCAQCREKFSIRVGTIFEDSKIPLRKWLAAIWIITSHKKGIASTTLAKDIDVTQKTAWFMLHRLRHAARTRSFNRPLRGDVEVDESYFGGKDRNRHKHQRGQTKKAMVVGLLERHGELRTARALWPKQMRSIVEKQVSPEAVLMTDETTLLHGIEATHDRRTVNHNKGQYTNGNTHTNSIEGVWSLIKRQIYGIHHFVSAKHLNKYLAEATWRYNRRELKETPRMREFLTRLNGRLTYAELTAPSLA
jgi:transposase-like protein